MPIVVSAAQSDAADILAACAEACRQPVLLHALAQLRRQNICPVQHAGAVSVRMYRRTLCTERFAVEVMQHAAFAHTQVRSYLNVEPG